MLRCQQRAVDITTHKLHGLSLLASVEREAARARQRAAEAEEDEREAARERQAAAEAEDEEAMAEEDEATSLGTSMPKKVGKRKIIHHKLDPSLLAGGVGGGIAALAILGALLALRRRRHESRLETLEVAKQAPSATEVSASADECASPSVGEVRRRDSLDLQTPGLSASKNRV